MQKESYPFTFEHHCTHHGHLMWFCNSHPIEKEIGRVIKCAWNQVQGLSHEKKKKQVSSHEMTATFLELYNLLSCHHRTHGKVLIHRSVADIP